MGAHVQVVQCQRTRAAHQWRDTSEEIEYTFYRATAYNATHSIAVIIVSLSLRTSVTRVDCDKAKWCTADILILA